jgi:ABC-type bacteriocin/lantibiotic exporter with double-glycine peptidase domain
MNRKIDWLWIFQQAYKGKIMVVCLSVAFCFVGFACELTVPLVFKQVFDKALPANNYYLVLGLGSICFLLLASTYVFGYLYNVLVTKANVEAINNLRIVTLRAVLVKFWRGSIANVKQGKLLSRILTDPDSFINNTGINCIITSAKAMLTVVAVVIVMIYLDWPMALVCLVVSIISVVSQYKMPRNLERSNQQVALHRANVTNIVGNILATWRTLVRHHRIDHEVAYVGKPLMGLSVLQKNAINKMHKANLWNVLIMNLATFILMLLGSFRIVSGEMSIGALLVFYTYFFIMKTSLETLFEIGLSIFAGRGQAITFARLISSEKNEEKLVHHCDCPDIIRTLYIKHLAINAGKFTFKADEIYFSEGFTYLLTGKSGAGKSTFLEFLAGLRKADRAKIFINNCRVETDEFLQMARAFGYVEKAELLLDRSISENIYTSSSDESRWIEEYAQILGMDYYLRKSVTGLSSGEKQMISLIREIIRKPALFIIDEGVDSLDKSLKTKVLNLIRKELPKCIIIICTHNWQNDIDVDEKLSMSDFQIYQENSLNLVKSDNLP